MLDEPSDECITATREDVDEFCTTEGWQRVSGPGGRPVLQPRTYELELWDGAILIARVAPSSAGTWYSRSAWAHLLLNSLAVDQSAFWACVTDNVMPDRGAPAQQRPGLPYYLLRQLTSIVGVPAEEAASLSEAAATERLADYWRTYGASTPARQDIER